MPDLATLHSLWRYSHIAIGCLGLIVFWIPVFAKKGSPLHIRCGRLFVYCGYWVVATALLSCTFVFVAPITFQTMRGGTAEEAARYVDDLQFLFGILGFLAINVLGGLRMGVRVVQTKQNPELLATGGLRTLIALGGVAGAALFAFGVWHMRTAGVGSRYMVCVVVGVLASWTA